MTRRVFTYPNLPGWGTMNLVSTIGAFILGFSVLMLAWNIIWSLRHGEAAGDNPWNAWTLEWATPSPPPEHNFERIPPVHSRLRSGIDAPAGCEACRRENGFLPEKNRSSMIVFLVSEAFFFLMLFFAFLYYNYTPGAGPTAASSLDARKTLVFTLCLLARPQSKEQQQPRGSLPTGGSAPHMLTMLKSQGRSKGTNCQTCRRRMFGNDSGAESGQPTSRPSWRPWQPPAFQSPAVTSTAPVAAGSVLTRQAPLL